LKLGGGGPETHGRYRAHRGTKATLGDCDGRGEGSANRRPCKRKEKNQENNVPQEKRSLGVLVRVRTGERNSSAASPGPGLPRKKGSISGVGRKMTSEDTIGRATRTGELYRIHTDGSTDKDC